MKTPAPGRISFHLLVARDEAAQLRGAALSPAIALVSVSVKGKQAVFECAGETLERGALGVMFGSFLGAYALSAPAARTLREALLAHCPGIDLAADTTALAVAGAPEPAPPFEHYVQARLALACARMATEAAQLHRALAVTRKDYTAMQLAFSALDDFVAHHVSAADVVSFVAEPSHHMLAHVLAGPASAAVVIEQPLPVSSQGLAALELYLPAVPARAHGALALELWSKEADAPLASWTAPAAQLRQGWNTFALARTDAGPAQSLTLRLRTGGAAAALVRELALSAMCPLPEFRLRLDGVAREGAAGLSLAFRCRRFMPGLRAPKLAGAFYPADAGAVDTRPFKSRHDDFRSATDAGPACAPDQPQLVSALDDASRLLVHPRENAISAAHLQGVCPPDIARVTAHVMTENAQASDIYYGVALVDAAERFKAGVSDADLQRLGQHFSGWHPMRPLSRGQVHLFLPAPTSACASLLLMTRLAEGGSTANAWSIFQSLEFFPAQAEAGAVAA